MKKSFLLSFVVFVLLTVTASAANNVSEMDITVTIRPDGSAYIVQDWRGTFSEGTENYIPINTDGIEVTDFVVSDEYGAFETVSDWDIDASFEEKARKCGINKTSNGIELCFGISEYGEKRYAVEYAVQGFIKSYSNYDGTNFMLVNPNMTTFPTDCTVHIVLSDGTALDESNCAIWAFGYDGNIEFDSGQVVACTESALSGSEHVIVMLRLDKGILTPMMSENYSFDKVREEAFEGSDYGDSSPGILFKILLALIALGVTFGAFFAAVRTIQRKLELRKFCKESQYFRGSPNGGDLETSYFLTQRFDVSKDSSLIIGATVLSMINSGALTTVTEESVGLFGRTKASVNLKLEHSPEGELEKRLYKILKPAAGSDRILQEKELGKYAQKHPSLLESFMDNSEANGEYNFAKLGGFAEKRGSRIKNLSDRGKKELSEVMGLKKYLSEFSLIAERQVAEVEIWKDYLVYATLFGIADKTIEQLKKVYPEYTEQIDTLSGNVVIAGSYYNVMYSSYARAVQAQRTSGRGGAASFGGGGGFSGGGSGGGSR